MTAGNLGAGNGKRMDPVENEHEKRLSEMILPKFTLEPPELFSLYSFPDDCPSIQLSPCLSLFLGNDQRGLNLLVFLMKSSSESIDDHQPLLP